MNILHFYKFIKFIYGEKMHSYKIIIQSLYFTFLISLLLMNSCSASQPAEVVKKIVVSVNSKPPIQYDVPTTLTFQIGDTVEVAAIVSPPYKFNGWQGGISGKENPKKIIINQPLSITINYVTGLAFQVSMANSLFQDSHTFEFDVVIRTFTEAFVLTAYQFVISYNKLWRNSGNLTINYELGSSQLNNKPTGALGWRITQDGGYALTFASPQPGIDSIGIVPKIIGRFKITNDSSFSFIEPVGMDFRFVAPENTILTGENITDITQYGTFIKLPEAHKVKIDIQ